jgi:hypothetical protein
MGKESNTDGFIVRIVRLRRRYIRVTSNPVLVIDGSRCSKREEWYDEICTRTSHTNGSLLVT